MLAWKAQLLEPLLYHSVTVSLPLALALAQLSLVPGFATQPESIGELLGPTQELQKSACRARCSRVSLAASDHTSI